MNLAIATLSPVVFGMLLIVMIERQFPYREDWQPNRGDVVNDVLYMAIVQNILPKFLGFILALTALNAQLFDVESLAGLWPHHWPSWGQMLLMLGCAEFLRYWLHRLAHNWPPLWRLHAIHHSPPKLYTLNVGRFHPFEKTLQFLCDALPFMLLSVSENVLALYFVFYALNGLLQHCNITVRLGYLNFIVSGPELHRWHHSQRVEESNHNFGNNLIIWDLLFGTWFLPSHRKVLALGLTNSNYPMGFMQQLAIPFKNNPDKFSREP